MKLQEKYEYYLKLIREYEDSIINTWNLNLPDTIYVVDKYGKITTKKIAYKRYSNGIKTSEPTRKVIKQIKDYYDNQPAPTIDKLIFYTEYEDDMFITTEFFKFDDIEDKVNRIILNREVAERLSKTITDKKYKDELLISSGTHKLCNYCGKLRPVSTMVQGIVRSGTKKVIEDYCNNECLTLKQMGQDG